ncbi:gas vesicle protein [Salibacterium aidingense]|uniref:gas vesicle protein n=1 Tax=Salibacterium aidingense TaxID=384933 RepID=UPI000417321D|nr:gas vesicle protein [Salibacterium aidingense]
MEDNSLKNQDVSLLDILDAVLDKGVVLRGDLTITVADVDLVYLDLKVLISSVSKLQESASMGGETEKEGQKNGGKE